MIFSGRTKVDDGAMNLHESAKMRDPSRGISSFRKGLQAAGLLAASLLPGQAGASPSPLKMAPLSANSRMTAQGIINVSNLDEVISKFDPSVHVYVCNSATGQREDDPIAESQLIELATFLADKDYYLVVVGKAKGYSFTSPAGTRFRDKEAVQVMLGQKLFENSLFASKSELIEGSQYKSRSLFVLTLDPGQGTRGWFFSSSEALERFGIKDETSWTSGLSLGVPALPLLKARKFADAVKLTIALIEKEKSKQLSQVEARVDSARTLIESTSKLYQQYQNNLAELDSNFPGRGGNLFKPTDNNSFVSSLTSAPSLLAAGRYSDLESSLRPLATLLSERVRDISDYPKAQATLQEISAQASIAEQSDLSFMMKDAIERAKSASDKANLEWQRGDSTYRESLDIAKRENLALENAQINSRTKYSTDGTLLDNLQLKLQSAKESEYYASASSEIEDLQGRFGSLKEKWNKKDPAYPNILREFDEEAQAAFGTIKTAERDAKSKQAKERFAKLMGSLLAAGAIGLAFFRRKSVKRGRETFEQLIEERLTREKNLTSELEAVDALKSSACFKAGQLISFPPDSKEALLVSEGLRAIEDLWVLQIIAKQEIIKSARRSANRAGFFSLAGVNQGRAILEGQPIDFSEDQRLLVHRAMTEPAKRATCTAPTPTELAEFGASMKEVERQTRTLLDRATENFEEFSLARERSEKNIEAASHALSKLEEIKNLSGLDESLITKLGALKEEIVAKSEATPITTEEELDHLVQITSSIVAFSSDLETIEGARAALAKTLGKGVNPDKLFSEEPYAVEPIVDSVNRILHKLSSSLQGAGTLDGNIGNAYSEIEALRIKLESSTKITLDSAKDLTKLLAPTRKGQSEITQRCESANNILRDLVSSYDRAVLILTESEVGEQPSDLTIENNGDEARSALSEAETRLGSIKDLIGAGKLIEAAIKTKEAAAYQKFAESRAVEIEARKTSIDKVRTENENQQRILIRTKAKIEKQLKDFRATTNLISSYEKRIAPLLQKIDKSANLEQPNPFKLAALLEDGLSQALGLSAAFEAKFKEHDSLIKKVRQGAPAIREALQTATLSASDSLPDSKKAIEAQGSIHGLKKQYDDVVKALENGAKKRRPYDWEDLENTLTSIEAQILGQKEVIEKDMAQATKVLDLRKRAKDARDDLKQFKGSYGITVEASLGANEYKKGNRDYMSGDFKSAERSFKAAEKAITEVLSEARDQIAEEKRRRNRARQDSGYGRSYHSTSDDSLAADLLSAAINIGSSISHSHGSSHSSGWGSGGGSSSGGFFDSVSSTLSDIGESGGSSLDF